MLLASGKVPPNPSELLSGRRMAEILSSLQREADVVLVDCPPVIPVTDAAVVSNRVDGTLLVATAGNTTRKQLRRATELLQQVDAPLIGMVLNGVTDEASYADAYRYSYYSQEHPRQSSRAGEAVAVR